MTGAPAPPRRRRRGRSPRRGARRRRSLARLPGDGLEVVGDVLAPGLGRRRVAARVEPLARVPLGKAGRGRRSYRSMASVMSFLSASHLARSCFHVSVPGADVLGDHPSSDCMRAPRDGFSRCSASSSSCCCLSCRTNSDWARADSPEFPKPRPPAAPREPGSALRASLCARPGSPRPLPDELRRSSVPRLPGRGRHSPSRRAADGPVRGRRRAASDSASWPVTWPSESARRSSGCATPRLDAASCLPASAGFPPPSAVGLGRLRAAAADARRCARPTGRAPPA